MLEQTITTFCNMLYENEIRDVKVSAGKGNVIARALVTTPTHEYQFSYAIRTGMLTVTINECKPTGERVFVTQIVTNQYQAEYVVAMISDGFAAMFQEEE